VGANATIGTSAWLVIGCWWMLVIMWLDKDPSERSR
jgi:hypothetical protein